MQRELGGAVGSCAGRRHQGSASMHTKLATTLQPAGSRRGLQSRHEKNRYSGLYLQVSHSLSQAQLSALPLTAKASTQQAGLLRLNTAPKASDLAHLHTSVCSHC